MSLKGKPTEKKLTAYLKFLMQDPDWWFHRFPDAGVCMGRIQKQPADYMIMYRGDSALLEVKECESHTSIPKSRLTQLAKMKRFEMAGGLGLFIIHIPDKREWMYFDPMWVDSYQDRKSVPFHNLDKYKSLDELFARLLLVASPLN